MIPKKAGIYSALGKEMNAIVTIRGEFPYFDITTGISLDRLWHESLITELTLPELAYIKTNTESFLFLPIINDMLTGSLPFPKNTNLPKARVEFSKDEEEKWIAKYKQVKSYGGDEQSLISYLMFEGPYNSIQATNLLEYIAKKVKHEEKKQTKSYTLQHTF